MRYFCLGKPGGGSSLDHRRIKITNYCLILLAVISLGYSLYNLIHLDKKLLGFAEMAVFIIALLALIDMRVRQNIEFSAWVAVLACGTLSIFFYWHAKGEVFSGIWMAFFVLINFLLLGTRKGSMVFITFISTIFFIVLFYQGEWPSISSTTSLINLFGAMIAIGATSYYQERSREADHARIEALANQDSLTGTSNRRHFMQLFEHSRQSLRLQGGKYALLLIDIDHFKSVNDTYGHYVGDQVINTVAKRTLSKIRSQDILARIGGEEFCLLILGCDEHAAIQRAEEIRKVICTQPVIAGSVKVSITISIGVICGDPNSIGFEDMFEKADKNLYIAKNKGRNQVIACSSIKVS